MRSLLGALGGISGRKLYILGVAGYNTPIWDVLALQGKREEAGKGLYGAKFENYVPIRQAVPVGLAQAQFCCCARWAWSFAVKKVYITRSNVFTCNLQFYIRLGTREWVDGRGWVWMTFLFRNLSHLNYLRSSTFTAGVLYII